jgi:uracil-DNA glycosylase
VIKALTKTKTSSSDEEGDSSDEEILPVKKSKTIAKRSIKKKEIISLSVEEEEKVPPAEVEEEKEIPEDISIYEVAINYAPPTWKEHFESKKKEIKVVSDLLAKRALSGEVHTPCNSNIFRAFHLTKPNNIKVVIVGQDPYPGAGIADGLSFSSQNIPASLKNIFKEINNSYPNTPPPTDGRLDRWAKQGVFLINTCLTCPVGNAGGHSKFNIWIPFIAATLKLVGKLNPDCYYLLWGKTAQECKQYISGKADKILMSSHPSPLSATRGFLGCGHFEMVNKGLTVPIKW